MELIDEYRLQQTWRKWEEYLNFIPINSNDSILDLGCSVGNVSHLLSKRVKKVVGIDLCSKFVDFCNENKQGNEAFICKDFLDLDFTSLDKYNGVWSSFSLSYVASPQIFIDSVYESMPTGGWIAVLDVSNFISGNMDKHSKYYKRVREFEDNSYRSGIYDFNFGSKQNSLLTNSGFKVIYFNDDVFDVELNFDGPASNEVILAWESRLNRLIGLRKLLKDDYGDFCSEFIAYIKSCNHRKNGNLKFSVAVK